MDRHLPASRALVALCESPVVVRAIVRPAAMFALPQAAIHRLQ
jgi:hypothetical protein